MGHNFKNNLKSGKSKSIKTRAVAVDMSNVKLHKLSEAEIKSAKIPSYEYTL